MIKTYGKAALVAAIAGSCGYVSAATVVVTDDAGGANVSLEGASAGRIALTTVVLTMGDVYQVGDRVTLSLGGSTGAKFATYAGNAPSITCTSGDFVIESPALTSAAATADFVVSGKSANVTSIGKVCTFASLAVLGSSITSSGVVSISSSKTVGTGTDAGSAVTVLTVASQIAGITVLSALNGIVDYQNSLGLTFASDDGGVATNLGGNGDQLTLQITSNDGMYLSTIGALSVTFSLAAASGKTFTFLDDNGSCGTSALLNRGTSSGRVGFGGGATNSLTINAACTALSYVGTTSALTGTARTVSLEFGHKDATPSTGVVIDPMVFPSLVATVSQGSSTRFTSAALNPGTWTSNGSTVQIPYMPINSTAGAGKIDPVIIISNRSAATGSITATLRDESGNTCSLTDAQLGTIAGNRTKSIGGTIRDAAAGSSCPTLNVAGGEKLSITLTVTLPSGSTEVYSGYTVGGANRVTVVNSSNGVPNP